MHNRNEIALLFPIKQAANFKCFCFLARLTGKMLLWTERVIVQDEK